MAPQLADDLLRSLKRTNRELTGREGEQVGPQEAETAAAALEAVLDGCEPAEAGAELLASGDLDELVAESAVLGKTAAAMPTVDVVARCAEKASDLLARPLFAQKLRQAREQAGYGVRELARASGVSNAYISQMEHAQASPPSLKVASRIARALGIAPDELAEFYPPALMPPLGDSDRAAVMRDPAVQEFLSLATELTPEQRRLVAEIARAVRQFGAEE